MPCTKVFGLQAMLALYMLVLFIITNYLLPISLLSPPWILSIPKSTGDDMVDPHWQHAMLDEIVVLQARGTWELVS